MSRCGLTNIGNTCYFNSALQVLYHLPQLRTLLNDNKKCSSSLKALFKQMDNAQVVQPREFHSVFRTIGGGVFNNFHQHDSQEALSAIIQQLDEESINVKTITIKCLIHSKIVQYLSDIKKMCIDKVVEEYYEYQKNHPIEKILSIASRDIINFYRKSYSPITDLFNGFLINTIRCHNCGYISIRLEPYSSLQLSLNGTNLIELLDHYTNDETIDWKCKCCNSRGADRKVQIWSLPKILILHFVRFKQGKKDSSLIQFDEKLDMTKYIHPCSKYIKFNDACTNSFSLKGVINHSGGVGGGHYTSQCMDTEWATYNDSHVKMASLEMGSAYVIIYEQN